MEGARAPNGRVQAARRTASRILQGYYMPDGGGANYGLGKHEQDFLTPGGRGIIVDPPEGILPMQAWAKAEAESRKLPERGYDDPTAHCFVAGVPRSMYVPSPLQILQPPGYVVILHERMSWRSDSARRPCRTCRTTCVSGRAIRSASGKAIRWSSRPRISTARRG